MDTFVKFVFELCVVIFMIAITLGFVFLIGISIYNSL